MPDFELQNTEKSRVKQGTKRVTHFWPGIERMMASDDGRSTRYHGVTKARHSRPAIFKSPTSSFFLISTEMTGRCWR